MIDWIIFFGCLLAYCVISSNERIEDLEEQYAHDHTTGTQEGILGTYDHTGEYVWGGLWWKDKDQQEADRLHDLKMKEAHRLKFCHCHREYQSIAQEAIWSGAIEFTDYCLKCDKEFLFKGYPQVSFDGWYMPQKEFDKQKFELEQRQFANYDWGDEKNPFEPFINKSDGSLTKIGKELYKIQSNWDFMDYVNVLSCISCSDKSCGGKIAFDGFCDMCELPYGYDPEERDSACEEMADIPDDEPTPCTRQPLEDVTVEVADTIENSYICTGKEIGLYLALVLITTSFVLACVTFAT